MRKIFVTIFILSLSLNLHAQNKKTAQDSIKTFYNELFSVLKTSYLHRKTINWQVVESETKQRLLQYNSFKNSLNEIKPLFDKIGATHCNIYYQQNKYTATGKTISKEDYSEQWKRKFNTKPGFELKVLDGKYGYILMPGMVFFDTSPENMHQIAQPLYDQIAEAKTKNKLEGWIIDLRFNTGGNIAPMLLALYDFLGDNDVWASLDVNKKQESKYKLKRGSYIQKSKTLASINPKDELLDKTKVAVITGLFTASSGELTAIAFKGRPNTTFIGESTYGATTANIFWALPFDVKMALTTTYDSDRNGKYYEQITPDIIVSKQDNFDDLRLDKNIREAIKFINYK